MSVTRLYLALFCLLAGFVLPVEAGATKYRWKRSNITISVSTSITANKTNLGFVVGPMAVVEQSAAAWQQAADLKLSLVGSNDQNVSPSGAQGDGVSLVTIAATPENLALFPRGLEDAAARTRVFYNANGIITEADIVLNPYLQFSSNGTHGTFDLESTLTHEIGHLLGLSHSPVLAATMSENYGRNGAYGLPAFGWRTLSADDIAAIRSVYGAADGVENCCGSIVGKLTGAKGKAAAGVTVWAEAADDGRVLAAAVTSADGTFRFGGLTGGKVRILSQDDRPDRYTSAVEVGEYIVSPSGMVSLAERIEFGPTISNTEYLGFNGQLAGLAIMVNSGGTYNILLGGTAFPSRPALGSDSHAISITGLPGSIDFGDGVDAYSFELSIDPETPNGEYSVFVSSGPMSRRYFIGGLAVEKFRNYWSNSMVK